MANIERTRAVERYTRVIFTSSVRSKNINIYLCVCVYVTKTERIGQRRDTVGLNTRVKGAEVGERMSVVSSTRAGDSRGRERTACSRITLCV